jgi:hypothetical protein
MHARHHLGGPDVWQPILDRWIIAPADQALRIPIMMSRFGRIFYDRKRTATGEGVAVLEPRSSSVDKTLSKETLPNRNVAIVRSECVLARLARALPPRSTAVTTIALRLPSRPLGWSSSLSRRDFVCLRRLPPTYVSSASTIPFRSPELSSIMARIRCPRNHTV